MKDEIKNWLLATKREGMEDLIEYLDMIGFFTAPASTQFHGAYEGALAEHSLNVFKLACDIAYKWLGVEEYEKIYNSIVICALLHDVGKCGQFGKQLYVPNVLKSGKLSDAKPYERNKDLMTLPHEIVSCIEVTKYIDLTEDEQLAIAWHNGLYGAFKYDIQGYDIQGKETPLYMIIHFADLWASRVVESKNKE